MDSELESMILMGALDFVLYAIFAKLEALQTNRCLGLVETSGFFALEV